MYTQKDCQVLEYSDTECLYIYLIFIFTYVFYLAIRVLVAARGSLAVAFELLVTARGI